MCVVLQAYTISTNGIIEDGVPIIAVSRWTLSSPVSPWKGNMCNTVLFASFQELPNGGFKVLVAFVIFRV